jgi:hypothetical protein
MAVARVGGESRPDHPASHTARGAEAAAPRDAPVR